jgi:pimeloyl-ACP methyl ester carboxylesterase
MSVSDVIATGAADARANGYLEAERGLWNYYGLTASERFIEVGSPAARLRVLEVGAGEPVLFVHGTIGPAWPPLVRELSDFRCLMIERPGWGLSSPIDFSRYEYKRVVADLLLGLLDALGIERAHVVGGSIGNVWALRLAQRHPSRVGRVVLLGEGPLLAEIPVPKIVKLIASPLGALMVRLPTKPKRVREDILRGAGHGASLDDGRIPDVLVEWRAALGTYTHSMRHERAMVRAIVSARSGWRPGLTFEDGELRALEHPTLLVYGTADRSPVESWRRFVDLLPRGELRLVDGAGHQPWFDDPTGVAADVTRFLKEEDVPQ